MKSEYKRIIVYIILVIVVPPLAYYGQLLIPESEEERTLHEAFDFRLSLGWYSSYANSELFFSKYIIEKWINDKKIPTAEETYKYIRTLKLSNDKYDYASVMSEDLSSYDFIKIYNNTESLLMISPSKKLSKICSLQKIKDEEICVIAFLPLKGLLKSSKLFVAPNDSGFYYHDEIKECYPKIYDSYLKWIPASKATKLIHLYKSNYDVFAKKWKNTKTLLNYDLLYSHDPRTFQGGPDPAKIDCAISITAFDFVLDYFRKNHDKVEAFVKELDSKNK
jgi:hypothetical protein